jgi:phosphohistidine phosphatase
MRTVILFRHGKSERPSGVDDHERPLARRGRDAAAVMGRFLAAAGQVPDLAITSTAVRARDTLLIAREAGGWKSPVVEERGLYDATPSDVVAAIRGLPASAARVLLVGHEPTWSETLAQLMGGGNVRFPTAAAACLDFDAATWATIALGSGDLVWFVPPRLLPAGD